MTKIKDLVTVIVDEAFARFPIDAERYELCGVLEDHLNETLSTSQLRLLPRADTRAEAWRKWAVDQVERAVMCSLLCLNGVHLSKRHDRLRLRFELSLSDVDLDTMMEDVVKYGKDYHVITILGKVSARLRKTDA